MGDFLARPDLVWPVQGGWAEAACLDIRDAFGRWVGLRPSGGDDTDLLVAAIAAADGGTLAIQPGTYSVGFVSANVLAGIRILGFGARLVNTTQAASSGGSPILKLTGSASADIGIEGLEVVGPRLTASAETGGFGGAGGSFPSALCIRTARQVVIDRVRASGSYFAGIDVRYAGDLKVSRCKVANHAYAGILFSDTTVADIDANVVDDVGAVMVTYGYGITAAGSMLPNGADGTGTNECVSMTRNVVTRCKRKSLDVHSGREVRIQGNEARGFGYGAIYAVCEGPSKLVRDVIVSGNQIYRDAAFYDVSTTEAIGVGTSGADVSEEGSFKVTDNQLHGIHSQAPIHVYVGDNAAKHIRSVDVSGNTLRDGDVQNLVAFDSGFASTVDAVRISGNIDTNTAHSGAAFVLRNQGSALVIGNQIGGTLAGAYLDTVAAAVTSKNLLNGVEVP